MIQKIWFGDYPSINEILLSDFQQVSTIVLHDGFSYSRQIFFIHDSACFVIRDSFSKNPN